MRCIDGAKWETAQREAELSNLSQQIDALSPNRARLRYSKSNDA
ncbi:hypothetical protein CP97_14659 [Aurantiacibacter atlanticus]|uniref:Uncharacterized protein n=1 Tax=Aurantiacibacter atlanticus TaxID=1648404 RepID=A0A168M0A9_9SPHN|nr:hypothetical protein CP97_14659 [Aurantiacibacter atlanticus]